MSLMSYLRFVLAEGADRESFEEDLRTMLERATSQPGFQWAEIGRDPWDDRRFVVVSEWDDVENVRAWEHHPEHEAVIDRWDKQYQDEAVHRRFVPWIRPEA
ncbi:MAG: antibiotic biosynthesis monooxygenase family protein [Actinomycetota bacterium]